MSKVPKKIRDEVLLTADFTCCSCGQRFFCDVHHIVPLSQGGTDNIDNLALLCPNCHRMAHRGAITQSQVRQLQHKHLTAVKAAVASKTLANQIQESQIEAFVFARCIERPYSRGDYLELDLADLYMLCFDILEAGFVVDPTDQQPILISKEDLHQLSSLEVVSSMFRFIFLEEMQASDPDPPRSYFIVRADILSAVSAIEADVAGAGQKSNSDIEPVRVFRESLKRLIISARRRTGSIVCSNH